MRDINFVLAQMKPVQRRRYKFYLKGWSLTKIAEKEGVSIEAVRKSIYSGEKRAEKRLRGLKKDEIF